MTIADCPDGATRDLLPLFVSGALPPADRARVKAHVATCADCAAEVELLQAVNRAYPARPVNVAAIAARLTAPRRAGRVSVPFHRQPLWRAAASLTLFIVGTATVLVVRGREPQGGPLPHAQVSPVAPPETTLASANPGGGARGSSNGIFSLGTDLSGLTDAQLESLLGSLDGLDSRPQADPTTIATPIIQEQPQAPDRNNQ